MLLRIVEILFPLFALALVGFIVGKRVRPDMTHANALNMDVFIPALIFTALAGRDVPLAEFAPLAFATVALIFGSGLIAWGVARLCGIQVKTLVPPMMFNNSGNLGLPLAVLAFGDAALAPAIVMFMLSNLLHFTVGAWLLDRRVRLWSVWKVPSVLASIIGVGFGLGGIELWAPAMTAIRMLGDISIPLMLFALGVRLAQSEFSALGIGLFGGVLRPLSGMLLAWLLLLVVPLPPLQQALFFVFGSLPPAVLNYMFAERYAQEPERVASIVLVGNLLGILTLPLSLALMLD